MQPSISFKQRNYTKKGQETLEEKRKIMSKSTEGEQNSQKEHNINLCMLICQPVGIDLLPYLFVLYVNIF